MVRGAADLGMGGAGDEDGTLEIDESQLNNWVEAIRKVKPVKSDTAGGGGGGGGSMVDGAASEGGSHGGGDNDGGWEAGAAGGDGKEPKQLS